MCLAEVIRQDTNEVMMESVSRVTVDGDTVIIRDLFGSTTQIKGSIVAADFENNKLVIAPAE